ncbi:hypothetical protein SANTM175S_05277 [Streptomyces antimycoticus]
MICSAAVKYARCGVPRYRWTAMYAVSRPEAVDSGMSSAGAVRTSTGKLTRSPDRSTVALSSRSTVTAASRGTAYSISRKRTRRGEVKTL